MERGRICELARGAARNYAELTWLINEHLEPLGVARILEIGAYQGGNTCLFANLVGEMGRVVGVGLSASEIAADVLFLPNLQLIIGDSNDSNTAARVREIMPECDFLLIDGRHTREIVARNTELYLPFLRPGGLLAWHYVRLESPRGIRDYWNRELRTLFEGSFEYYHEPSPEWPNTEVCGFGLWYKSRRGNVVERPAFNAFNFPYIDR